MIEKIYVGTGLGPGDDGKGGVKHAISVMRDALVFLKVGGAQGSHGVHTSRGERFAFNQWGCGTFEGVRTHLTSRFVVSPVGLLDEADALRYQCGIHNAFDLLTVDARALCATPYHGIASRLKELVRGTSPRGTIGSGVGDAYRDSLRVPELAIYVQDLERPDLRDRLAAIREFKLRDLRAILEGDFPSEDRAAAGEEFSRLVDDDFLALVVKWFQEVAQRAHIVDGDYLGREILSQDGIAVVESSHGILTDCCHGFHPHTSALRTLPCFTHDMLHEAGYDGQVVNIGVTRAYSIRHGAGPLPTADPAMGEHLLPGSHKEENRYQGKVRVGPLDLVLLRYAIEVAGGPSAFDGLAITWFDQIQTNGVWHICDRYQNANNSTFFSPTGELKVRRGTDAAQLDYQEKLGQQLLGCVPEITSYELPSVAGRDELFSFCADVLKSKLGVPVRMVSFGPTEQDKVCK